MLHFYLFHKYRGLLAICLLLLAIPSFSQDVPRDESTSRISRTNESEPQASDERFLNGSGDDFDQYLFRRNRENGKLSFHVDITRFYTSLMKFDSEGFLTNAPELIRLGLIPKDVRLTMRVYDVDHNSQYDGNFDGIADPEVDHIYVNGKRIDDSNGFAWTLSSGNDTWSTPSRMIPVEYIKFPTSAGNAQSPPKGASNLIEIDIDVPNTTFWAVECDWISLEIENKIRPVVLVRGYRGVSEEPAQKIWEHYAKFLAKDGIPYHIATTIDPCGAILVNAANIANEIQIAKNFYGVKKVNIIAHSKGGLDARAYLRTAQEAENLIQLGTPNHGSDFAYFPLECQPARDQLKPFWLSRRFNYIDGVRGTVNPYDDERSSGTKIFLFTGLLDLVVSSNRATLPWNADYENNDFTNPVNSVSTENFLTLGHSGLREDNDVYQAAIELMAPDVVTSNGGRTSSETEEHGINAEISDSLSIVFVHEESLKANATETKSVYISIAGIAIFKGAFGDAEAGFTLKSPSGKIYNSASPEFSSDKDFGLMNYNIPTAEKGLWSVVIKGGKAATASGIRAYSQTNRKLTVSANGNKSDFKVDEVVPVKATLMLAKAPATKAKGIVYFVKSAKKDSLELFDDGNHDDGASADGIYANNTLKFNEPGIKELLVKFQQDNETIYRDLPVSIIPASAEFSNTFNEKLLDTNQDGFTDSLQIITNIVIKKKGHYTVTATLRDSQGKSITSSSWTSLKGNPLNEGTYQIPLNFSGEAIGNNGVNGPYKLDNLTLNDITYSVETDVRNNAYTTRGYDVNIFPRQPITLTGQNSETPVDSDGDGDIDFLDIKVQINVNKSGYYNVSAELIDSLQNTLNWTENYLRLNVGINEITLRFDGQEINEKLSSGRFVLTNLHMFNSNSQAYVTFYDVYKTNAYLFSNFTGNYLNGTILDKTTKKPVENATVVVSGAKLATAQTDKNGKYIVAGLPNGSYHVEVTKNGYCGSKMIDVSKPQNNASIDFEIIPDKIDLAKSSQLQLCQGDSLVIKVSGEWDKFKWSNGSSANQITIKQSGTFYMTASFETCVAYSDTITVKLTEITKPVIQVTDVIDLSSSSTSDNQWFMDGVPIAGATSPNYKLTSSGSYTVQVTKDGCKSISDPYAIVITGIENHGNHGNVIAAYPNPTSGLVNVKLALPKPGPASFQLFGTSGSAHQTWTLSAKEKEHETTIDIRNVPAGLYLIRTQIGGKFFTVKILKN